MDRGVGVDQRQRTAGIRPSSAAGPTHRTAVAQGKPERDNGEVGRMASRVPSMTANVRPTRNAVCGGEHGEPHERRIRASHRFAL